MAKARKWTPTPRSSLVRPVEFIYFWTTKDNYYGPITVEFDSSSSSDSNPSVMHFDTTGRESDEYKAAREAAEAIEAQGGIDFPSYSIIPADGWKLGDRIDEKYEGCDFKRGDETISSIDMRTFKTSPMMEAEARQGSKKKGVIDEVEVNGTTWVRYTSEAGAVSLFVEAPSGQDGLDGHRLQIDLGRCASHGAERGAEVGKRAVGFGRGVACAPGIWAVGRFAACRCAAYSY